MQKFQAFFLANRNPKANPRRNVTVITIHLGAENRVQMRNWKDVCSKFWRMKMNPIITAMTMKMIFPFSPIPLNPITIPVI